MNKEPIIINFPKITIQINNNNYFFNPEKIYNLIDTETKY